MYKPIFESICVILYAQNWVQSNVGVRIMCVDLYNVCT